jgi:hypothetical protein
MAMARGSDFCGGGSGNVVLWRLLKLGVAAVGIVVVGVVVIAAVATVAIVFVPVVIAAAVCIFRCYHYPLCRNRHQILPPPPTHLFQRKTYTFTEKMVEATLAPRSGAIKSMWYSSEKKSTPLERRRLKACVSARFGIWLIILLLGFLLDSFVKYNQIAAPICFYISGVHSR